MIAMTRKRWWLAAAVAAALGAAPAQAQMPRSSGGPGALGTSVPFDSRVAREYFNYELPTDTPEALRIRDGVQKLHADHLAIMDLGRLGGGQRPEVRRLAQQLSDRLSAVDWTLVEVARDSLLALAGPAHDEALRANAAAVQEVQAAAGAERDARFVATSLRLLEGALATVDELRPQAKEARRQQLGSVLDRDRKLLRELVRSARSLSTSVAAAAP